MESTVFKEMHLEEGARGAALYAPPEFSAMAAGQRQVAFPAKGPYDFVVLFARDLEEYRARIAEAREALARDGVLWVAFPKPRGARSRTFGWNALWLLARREGLEEYRGCVLDASWALACFRQAAEKH